MRTMNQTFTMIIPDVPFIDESNNRYFDGPFVNDTMILEFNKE